MLRWLKGRWLTARWLRSIANGMAGAPVLVSILSSFASAIIATGSFPDIPSSKAVAVAVAALPGVCLTILRQFPFREWARFQNTRYILYREIYFKLEYGTVDLATAVEQINAAGRELAKAADAMPFVNFQDANNNKDAD
jgi:hypothetical protein